MPVFDYTDTDETSGTWRTIVPTIPKDKLIVGNKYLVMTSNNEKFMEFKGYDNRNRPVFYNDGCCCYHVEKRRILSYPAYGEELETPYNTGKGECLNRCGDTGDDICRYERGSCGGKKRKSKSLHSIRKTKGRKNKKKKTRTNRKK